MEKSFWSVLAFMFALALAVQYFKESKWEGAFFPPQGAKIGGEIGQATLHFGPFDTKDACETAAKARVEWFGGTYRCFKQ